MADHTIEYGIIYSKSNIGPNKYLLFPLDLVEGYQMGDTFLSDPVYKTADSKENISNSDFLVDNIFTYNDLLRHYEYDDIDFVKEYYLADAKDYFYYVEITPKEIIKRKLNMSLLSSLNPRETYEAQNKEAAVALNSDALSILLSIADLDALRKELLRYQNLVSKFKNEEMKKGTTKIAVEQGHVVEIQTTRQCKNNPQVATISEEETIKEYTGDVSLKGLESYIKERVFGHDEAIKIIAKTLLMNYRANTKYGTEPILILGPTGTGKTETIKAASEYLGIPFLEINTANLVPQGIKGTSIEDCLYSLLASCNYDMDKAERALIFFDEFDKIGESDLDIKSAVKEIMLKFFEGSTFLIDKPSDDYSFNTRMLNKVYAGAFQNLFDAKKSIGFGTPPTITTLNRSRIYEDHYFGKELVTRIPHILTFNPLDRETQKRVILESKLSILLRKKARYEEEFHTSLIATDAYIDAVLTKLAASEKSMRDLNNIILDSLNQVEYVLLANEGHTSEVILTDETVENPYKFTLK